MSGALETSLATVSNETIDSDGVEKPEDNPVMEVLANETLDPTWWLLSSTLLFGSLSPLPLANIDLMLLTSPLPVLFFLSSGKVCVLEKLLASDRLVLQTGAV